MGQGNIEGQFADQNSYVLSGLIATARSNQNDLNVIIQENDYLKASSAVYQQQGLTSNPANPVPIVTTVTSQTIGAAVGGVDQPAGNPLDDRDRNRFNPNEQ